ncbi:DNA-binding NtrC family response regulator [Desulfobaculum xiamenense]|uniref:DNA-binding NtrC family response regulator n=1 Tax=Desulfobaculum xiamenense TaxID=995050 RepID=A0A846QI31_9BACT|nr:sigma-54 dependent transcriptional regulator [Desulfobaculum xiamenense]NJB68506.1 DNA-binding NtrC family response regulator [Desulfobaculum xiamenense]
MIKIDNTPYPSFGILLVDDELAWLRSLRLTLERSAGISNIRTCADSRQVMDILDEGGIGLILLDLTMPGLGGEELLTLIGEQHQDIQVIVISGLNQLETAVRCIKQGAFDYFVKTDAQEHITKGVLHAIRTREMQSVNDGMRQRILSGELENPEAFEDIASVSPTMLAVFQYVEAVAASSQPVLVTGESGVGKELVAKAVHQVSGRKGPLVSVNVAGLDDTSFSDTLFGHKRGAFTGAATARAGMIEQAYGGTLFLDEIGDLSLQSQVKLLRLLQEGEYFPLGSDRPKLMQARVVVATHQDLPEKVQRGEFRKDLFYRLCAHHVHVPPLRERKADIPVLLDRFLEEAAAEFGKRKPAIPKELPVHLSTYAFPGNVRELRGMVFDAVSTHKAKVLSMQSFLKAMRREHELVDESALAGGGARPFAGLEPLPTIAESTVLLIEEAMERAKGNQTLAARMLGISQPALSKRLKQLKS